MFFLNIFQRWYFIRINSYCSWRSPCWLKVRVWTSFRKMRYEYFIPTSWSVIILKSKSVVPQLLLHQISHRIKPPPYQTSHRINSSATASDLLPHQTPAISNHPPNQLLRHCIGSPTTSNLPHQPNTLSNLLPHQTSYRTNLHHSKQSTESAFQM